MHQTILFVCPHSAAKSVMAAAYCERLAAQYGLDLHITSAGTEPDAAVSPAVATLLRDEGFEVTGYAPRRVSREELATASRVISLGCDLSELAPPGTTVEHWDDVPSPSTQLRAARDHIYAHVERLVNELSKPESSSPSHAPRVP
jgi:arsenate reductase (thioredoxin)